MKARAKPVEVEAVQFLGVRPPGLAKWSEAQPPLWLVEAQRIPFGEPGAVWLSAGWEPPQLLVGTLEGDHRAEVNDWIIRGVKGELYPCKPDIFAMTYDRVRT